MLLYIFSRLSVLIEYHKKYGVNFTIFEELTRKIKDNYSVIPVASDQPVWVCLNDTMTLNI